MAEPDPHFAHPRLAAIYDAFEGDRDDLAFYLGVAEESGRTVVGADPAGASLEIAKSKDQTGRITWIHGDATAVPPRSADTYRFLTDGTAVTSESTRRFRSRDEVAASLAACGYQVLDVRDAPDRPGREFVFIAQRTC